MSLRHRIKWIILRTFCDQVIAVSETARSHYITTGRIGPDKILTLHNGIDLHAFNNQKDREVAREALGLSKHATVISTVAVLREQKGVQFMIQALPALLERVPGLIYLIAGEGNYGKTLQDLVVERGLEKRAIFLGHRTDIPDLMAATDVFVLPTLNDALPTVLIEALAARVPIVATRVGGVPEMVVHEFNGLLVAPSDPVSLSQACLRLLGEKELTEKFTSNGWRIAQERFDIKVQAQKLASIYQKLLSENQYGR